MFNDPARNPNGAQLVFTTHDTHLLGTIVGEPVLRRDQVWFTEKDDNGATHLYPLTEFHPRKEENLERGYLQGRYGAVPFLGELVHEADSGEASDGGVGDASGDASGHRTDADAARGNSDGDRGA
jgi:AAA15 family ATPase/GTPase